MAKAVLISIQPKWCELIVSGKKTLEVRKTKPKLETPFKCYIYCTYGKGLIERSDIILPNFLIEQNVTKEKTWENCCNGKVIGEFVCDDCSLLTKAHYGYIEQHGCLSKEALNTYMGISGRELSTDDRCYGWHISELHIYDRPKYLSEFYKCGTLSLDDFEYQLYDGSGNPRRNSYASYLLTQKIRRTPQSWCYVE